LLSQGSKLYHQGDLAGALEKFEAAYVAFPSPKLMFNIGQANRDLGRPVEAVEAFQRFLAEATDASPETMAEARNSWLSCRASWEGFASTATRPVQRLRSTARASG
jgi:tetratricopeptide (TPR) repeat protein